MAGRDGGAASLTSDVQTRIKGLIEELREGNDLDRGDVAIGVTLLLSDTTSDDDKADFLTALHRKGETAEEIANFVEQLTERAVDPMIDPANVSGPMIDVCGTGGSGLNLFNVSTTIMFILAAGGAVVVKHGNRSVTSSCGSADVLEALGIKLEWPPEELKACVERLGVGFIFARQYHPAFRALASTRARLARAKTRTIFNLLGPLLNPARPQRQLIGVYAPRLTSVFAEVLRRLERERAWVVHGLADEGGGMDDISISGATTLAELENGSVHSAVVDTRWLNVKAAKLDELRGGDAGENAKTLTGILSGELQGPKRDMAVVNAAGAFVAAGLAREMGEGMWFAQQQIDSGRALKKLHALQNFR
ncbi:MAG TPA: anthranilate phosphoribosyltransferase [Chthoniobacterales bacterium]|nr:anthranilate phosphoribosyltransferase [Chthoniobacterales bacterium]